jgi:2-amino-4-hydroxy-6-hydroxymethyldihydropteridine diphosphokinase
MARIVLGLGSNVLGEFHLHAGVQALRQLDAELSLSPVYQSAAVGFKGDDFYNLVAVLHADIALSDLTLILSVIEAKFGRTKREVRFSAKTLDIDLLTYDDLSGVFDGVCLPRDEILDNAFVLRPLSDILPEALHPQLKKSYRSLWQELGEGMEALTLCAINL